MLRSDASSPSESMAIPSLLNESPKDAPCCSPRLFILQQLGPLAFDVKQEHVMEDEATGTGDTSESKRRTKKFRA
ncbi:hypothetical protein HDU93_004559, partial [Gonapodya sp. JEL0774]